MPYLVDGHNLIGQMPGLSLADPDDEAKLVQLLRRFASRRKKPVTVIFDRGLPGGKSALSGAGVEVRFAPSSSSADALIRRRVRELRDAPNWTVVTSDAELAAAARGRGARVMPSAEFAALLTAPGKAAEKGEPSLSKEEIERWEAEFRRKGKATRKK
jgi:predicted RNA-binding protein with PIN domain